MDTPARVLVLSTSLNPNSHSRRLGRIAFERLQKNGVAAEFITLKDLDLPHCDAGEAYGSPAAQHLKKAATACTHVLFAVPIYNYDVNGAAKTVVELVGGDLAGKTVGFLCSAGGKGSYMSILGFANSLMLDFRCWIVPRYVYALWEDWNGEELKPELDSRLNELLATIVAHHPPKIK